jgi:hypothetical protein
MADEGKKLSETTAGQELEHEILEQVVRHHRELTGVLEEMTQIQDVSMLRELEEDCRVLREQMVHWQAEARKLMGTLRENEPLAEPLPVEAIKAEIGDPLLLVRHTLTFSFCYSCECSSGPYTSIPACAATIFRFLDQT